MGIEEKLPDKGGNRPKPGLSETKISDEGEMVYANSMHESVVRDIISEQAEKGLKTDEMMLRAKAAEATKQIIRYLTEKYEDEKNGPIRRNLDLFKFFSRGPDKNNLFRLNRSLREKAGFEIDFSDPYIMAIGNEVMGKENFKRYLTAAALEVDDEDENKPAAGAARRL